MKKRVFSAIVFLFIMLLFFVVAINASNDVYNWYCMRNKEHKQPPIEKDMAFIEDNGGFYIDKNHSDDCSEKVIYLTFDAGYENGNVEKILDTLKEHNVPGAFFILGNLIKRAPNVVKRMAEEGHLVCNHTLNHGDMSKIGSKELLKEELNALEKLYKETTGKEMSKYFRPPEGKFSEQMMRYANELGYKTVFWSVAYADWDNNNQMSCDKAIKKIMDNIHNGAIILLHPTSETNARILGEVIVQLKEQGYRFGTLDEIKAN